MEWLAGVIAFAISVVAGLFPIRTIAYRALPISTEEKEEARVLFVGDMMFDRTIRTTMEEKGGDYVFSCIADVLREADLVVGNLEGPITSTSSVSVGSAIASPENFTFTFAPGVAPLLYRHNVRLVNIGNNHMLNFGVWGLEETKRYLNEAGVGYFGTIADDTMIYHSTTNNVLLSFINYNEFSPEVDDLIYQVNGTIAKRSRERKVVVVYAHWGEEYVPATERMKVLARQFVEAGADIVIGSHPHVIQEHEIYQGAPIYYSLGNFIFDQYWNDDVRTGLMLDVLFDERGVASVGEIPVELLRDRRTCPVTQ